MSPCRPAQSKAHEFPLPVRRTREKEEKGKRYSSFTLGLLRPDVPWLNTSNEATQRSPTGWGEAETTRKKPGLTSSARATALCRTGVGLCLS